MRKLLLIIIIGIVFGSCHSKKHVVSVTDEITQTTDISEEHTSTERNSIEHSQLSMLFDSLDVWIYDAPPVIAADSLAVHEGLCHGRTIHIKAAKATVTGDRIVAVKESIHTAKSDSITKFTEAHESIDETSETVAVSDPPNITILLIAIACIVAALFALSTMIKK